MQPDGSGWVGRAANLARQLVANGDIISAAWFAAVAAVPRHHLVPVFYEQDSTGEWHHRTVDSPDTVDRVYSSTTLVTQLVADAAGNQTACSSSTKPDLMVRMLELLDVHETDRVLEIGTGTGYNAALLCHRLGDSKVVSVDIDEDLIELARTRLSKIGHHPTLIARDGDTGAAEYGPFDRIITTTAAPAVPWAWAEQLNVGGLALVDLKLNVGAGNLALLHRHGDRMEGHFISRWAAFMAMRHHGRHDRAWTRGGTDAPPAERTTIAPAQPWQDCRIIWFLAQFHLPGNVSFGYRLDPDNYQPTAATLTAEDGSWAQVALDAGPTGDRLVRYGGPTPLWDSVDRTYREWLNLGQPGWERFGLTVLPDQQWVWLDSPQSQHTWPLRLID
jgi:protein-L-isoaspartate(D-aspartate) O-methyltransferase